MKLFVATLSIAFVNAAQAASTDSGPLAMTKIPIAGDYLKSQARAASDESLLTDLNSNEILYGHMTPQHVIDEILARANKPEKFEHIVELFTEQRVRYGIRANYFRDTNQKVLALKNPIPSGLDEAGVERLYKAACTGLEVPDCFKFSTNLIEKNYVNLSASSLSELVFANSGKLGTANQELPSALLLKIGQKISTMDPVFEDVLKIIPVYRELARFDGPGAGRNNFDLKRPATYQDKGAPQLKVRDQLLQIAFAKNPAETVRSAGNMIVKDFEAVAAATAGEIGEGSIKALVTEQKPIFLLFAKNADEAQFTELKSRLETISQTPVANEAGFAPGWRARNLKFFVSAIDAARAAR